MQAIDPPCGQQTADGREALERVWRNFHTATQHAIWLPTTKMAS